MNNVPNLDAMDVYELREFAKAITRCTKPVAVARTLFSEPYPELYVTTTKQLGHYAWNKLAAINSRGYGDILSAQMYEAICDRIYDELPEYAKW